MYPMQSRRPSFRSQWGSFLDEICTGAVGQSRLRHILDVLLYDGEDVRLSAFWGSSGATDSPALTPVERLLLFVSVAFGRLQDKVTTAQQDPSFRFEDHPEHFRRLSNLRRLVHLASMPKPPRAFSAIDRLRLYAQWSSFSYECAKRDGRARVYETSRKHSRAHLETLEQRISDLPLTDIQVQSIRAMCVYRRAVHAMLGPADQTPRGGDQLRELLSLPSAAIPPGLYFHAARQLYRLPRHLRGRVLRGCRMPVATAFGFMPESRVLDRIGICFLLGQDALLCDAPELAMKMVDAADALVASAPQLANVERTVGNIKRLRRELTARIDEARADRDDLAQYRMSAATQALVERVMAEARAAIKGGPQEAYSTLSVTRSEPFASVLCKEVCQSWVGRLIPNAKLPVSAPSFVEAVARALDQHRNQPLIGNLLRAGCVCRVLQARSGEKIDAAFEEDERLQAVSVLYADWHALVDQLDRRGNHSFLRKIGFEKESTRLDDLARYFERLFHVTITASSQDELLLGAALSSELRLSIDAIEERWKTSSAAEGTGFENILKWSEWYARRPQRADFCSTSEDPLVRQFFLDCGTVIDTEDRLPSAEGVDKISILTRMGWCARHICLVLRRVQGNGEKVRTCREMTDQEWLDKGVFWTDKARELAAAEQGRIAGLYSAVDARKRLEQLVKDEQNHALIEQLTGEMLRIDELRINTTGRLSRRNRAILRTERSLCEAMREHMVEHRESFRAAVPINTESMVGRWFALAQRLKSFNYGQLVEETAKRDEADPLEGSVGDKILDLSVSPDIFDRGETVVEDVLDREQQQMLWDHLRERQAAILDFVTHPGSGSTDVDAAYRNRWATICFVVKAGPSGLVVRPYYLPQLSEARLRLAIDGIPEEGLGSGRAGLLTLADWSDKMNGEETLEQLSEAVFPGFLEKELQGCARLYLCPHRHLFQVPIHALPLGRPIFSRFEISYALKTAHLMGLVSRSLKVASAPKRRLMFVDNGALVDNGADHSRRIQEWLLKNENQWGREGLGVEEVLAAGATADQAVICCHGQADAARRGRARLRLWGGGRLLADDIHRIAGSSAPARDTAVNLNGTDWLIAACDAGRPRVAMRTTPGLSLSLVTCGAGRVTSSLFRIKPEVAARFLSSFLTACDNRQSAPFTGAVREMYRMSGAAVARWSGAASFVSYGLM